ncbi:MAG: ATP phosphoribosyltransferase regulatory subunit [Pseudomonadota bacterium]
MLLETAVFDRLSASGLGRSAFAPQDYDGAALERLSAITDILMRIFGAEDAALVEPAILQPADILFDLYGEEIWERSFIIEDLEHGAWCLRPDFTAPVARSHLARAETGESARYRYCGPVFRRARGAGDGALQQLQAGVEVIDEADPATRDAEVFDLARQALDAAGCPPYDLVIGDLGLVFGLLDAVPMPDSWRARLRRHFWRPQRFSQLLRRLGGEAPSAGEASRMAFLKGFGALGEEDAARAISEMMALAETPQIGVRGSEEVAERFLRQAEDARAHPLPQASVDVIEAAVAVSGPADAALTRLKALAAEAKMDLSRQTTLFERRLEALSARGVEPSRLRFDAVFGRDLAYYDGFVFEMRPFPTKATPAPRRLGGGGRYDRLFQALGAERPVSGVGAALKPEAILAAIAAGDAAGAAAMDAGAAS